MVEIRLKRLRRELFWRLSIDVDGHTKAPGATAGLAENVRHHIKEEESEVFSKAKDANIDFTSLAETMMKRRATLLAKGVPPASEAAMVAGSHGRGDSPARSAAKATTRAPKARAAK